MQNLAPLFMWWRSQPSRWSWGLHAPSITLVFRGSGSSGPWQQGRFFQKDPPGHIRGCHKGLCSLHFVGASHQVRKALLSRRPSTWFSTDQKQAASAVHCHSEFVHLQPAWGTVHPLAQIHSEPKASLGSSTGPSRTQQSTWFLQSSIEGRNKEQNQTQDLPQRSPLRYLITQVRLWFINRLLSVFEDAQQKWPSIVGVLEGMQHFPPKRRRSETKTPWHKSLAMCFSEREREVEVGIRRPEALQFSSALPAATAIQLMEIKDTDQISQLLLC